MLKFWKRGYSHGFINHCTNKVKFLDRSFELKPKLKHQLKRIIFVTRFSPCAKLAMLLIKKQWPSIQHLTLFSNNLLPPVMIAYKSKILPGHDKASIFELYY